jgi:inositol hexakisphosphate/diphosphoinositol-pentakisphosphate kinase
MKHQMVIELSSEQAEELGAPGDPTSTTTTNSEESPEHSKFDETKPDDNFENAQVGERPTFSIPLQNKSKKQPPPNIPAATPNKPGCTDRIRLGICALDKKARSKPMAEILSRLDEDIFCVVFFGDAMILEEPVENWPVCDVLIAFFSKGYPLNKAKEYVKLRKPFILNDLDMQEVLQDRRRVYDLLEASVSIYRSEFCCHLLVFGPLCGKLNHLAAASCPCFRELRHLDMYIVL